MDRAVLPLSFVAGSALGLVVISVRLLLVPLAKHHGLLGRLGDLRIRVIH